ncbi:MULTISPECIES: siderophore-interacting protein [unclassified Chelatococcus]|uniref:siderophore-interacting protein n=1 Tax=unclassified Chelatococcus TaxID=2638111 RepID=UPI001BCEE618|nr:MULTISPECIES: siderophore-interacting protein [unclassified Chelatococcus]MBS7700582.1 siderophore-interacting protein [Chelatococcus sp. YT9]MBX3558697.1 siderophore-interacting protein [Chelatococcus sp.]
MTSPTSFHAQTHIELAEARIVIAELCAHMVEHDAQVEALGEERILKFRGACARFSRQGRATVVDLSAPSLEGLYFLRMTVAAHLKEFAGGNVAPIRWTGDAQDLTRPPNFQILRLRAIRDLTPHMRRLTLAGDDVARFAPLDALHVNILLQRPELSEPQWPSVGPDGLIAWPDPGLRPALRKYTIRNVDLAAGTIAVDFVLHADAGPGAALAEHAVVGQEIGTIGPGGGGLVAADWYLFAGDETALPAMARMLAHLPPTARGFAFIEVDDEREIQPLENRTQIHVSWLFRRGAVAGTTSLLIDAVMAAEFPSNGSRVYVWVGCEFDAFRSIRTHLRGERGLRKEDHLVVAYWRRGATGP